MTEITHRQESDRRATSPISRRAVHSFASSAPSTRPHHSHNVSDVSASSDPERPSPVVSPVPGLAVTPEGNAHDTNPMDNVLGSPVSPPLDDRGDPFGRQGSASGRVAVPDRTHKGSPSRRRTKSSFEENFE
ncbi:hypothetical protein GP486_008982 [Trichoglossum hirsutum]|uniref:Uncharacterized protein n=1 Tax=Trichoglossum hirsutum TaxID=265104 RepID=A0A9P8I0Z9_9PEZI|nr:hypothetical protein GP486_008982 [Trichoglossum hirsutum]